MPNDSLSVSDVKIYEPDHSLMAKIGSANLEQIFSKENVAKAQGAIENASESFLIDCLTEMIKLKQAFFTLQNSATPPHDNLRSLIDAAFKIKTETGLAGFDFIAAIAKSLQLFCEHLLQNAVTAKATAILKWHVDTLGQLLERRLRGSQSPTEKAILLELEKLAVCH